MKQQQLQVIGYMMDLNNGIHPILKISKRLSVGFIQLSFLDI